MHVTSAKEPYSFLQKSPMLVGLLRKNLYCARAVPPNADVALQTQRMALACMREFAGLSCARAPGRFCKRTASSKKPWDSWRIPNSLLRKSPRSLLQKSPFCKRPLCVFTRNRKPFFEKKIWRLFDSAGTKN